MQHPIVEEIEGKKKLIVKKGENCHINEMFDDALLYPLEPAYLGT